jgi:hypothetical protein
MKTITVTRWLDHVADRTGKPARSLLDGKKTKWVGQSGETRPKLVTSSPQPVLGPKSA